MLANLANERLGGRRGRYAPIHPNKHGLLDRGTLGRVLEPGALTEPRAVDVALRRRVQTAPAYTRFRAGHEL